MMGDPNQLQPIGNGAIFRDLMTVFDPAKLEVVKDLQMVVELVLIVRL